MLDKFKKHLIEIWSLVGSAILTLFTLYPEAMQHVWAFLPEDLREAIPPKYRPFIAISIIITGVVARMIKQEGKDNAASSAERKEEN